MNNLLSNIWNMSRSQPNSIHILVATPLGKGGQGGIDRIMDELRTVLDRDPPLDLSVTFGTTRGTRSIFLSPLYFISFIGRMAFLRITGRLDLLHINLASHGSTCRKLILARIASLLGIPYIIHLHGGLYQEFFKKTSKIIKLEILHFFHNAKIIIVLGKIWKNFIIYNINNDQNKIHILPNATFSRKIILHRNTHNEIVILFLGKVCNEKGISQLLDALNQLHSDSPWQAIIAGDGELTTAKSRIRELGLDGRIQLPGWVGPNDVESLIANADILVLPSLAENLPMSVVEGMAGGLAIVATTVGAVGEIISNNQTGLLVPPGDVTALADALRRLIENPGLRHRLGSAAAEYHSKHLEIGCYAHKLAELWRSASR